jgi:hypothetical protein
MTEPTTVKQYPTASERKATEPPSLRYARQTRNATCFLAILAALGLIASLIIGVVVGVSIANSNSGTSGGSGYSGCVSLGGTDPSC